MQNVLRSPRTKIELDLNYPLPPADTELQIKTIPVFREIQTELDLNYPLRPAKTELQMKTVPRSPRNKK